MIKITYKLYRAQYSGSRASRRVVCRLFSFYTIWSVCNINTWGDTEILPRRRETGQKQLADETTTKADKSQIKKT